LQSSQQTLRSRLSHHRDSPNDVFIIGNEAHTNNRARAADVGGVTDEEIEFHLRFLAQLHFAHGGRFPPAKGFGGGGNTAVLPTSV
jgi:hypothetical protein